MGKRGRKPQLKTALGEALVESDIDWVAWAAKASSDSAIKDSNHAILAAQVASEAMREVQRIRHREELGEATPEDRRAMASLLGVAYKMLKDSGLTIEECDEEDDF